MQSTIITFTLGEALILRDHLVSLGDPISQKLVADLEVDQQLEDLTDEEIRLLVECVEQSTLVSRYSDPRTTFRNPARLPVLLRNGRMLAEKISDLVGYSVQFPQE